MSFQNPFFLFGALAVAIPIAIHLWSKVKPRLIVFSSVKYIRQADIKRARRLKLTQIPLLIVRCLIVVSLVFLISGLTLHWNSSEPRSLLFFEEDLYQVPLLKERIDQFKEEGKDLQLLNTDEKNYWKVIKRVDNLGYDSIYIMTRGRYRNFQGSRPKIRTAAQWILVPSYNTVADSIVAVYQLGEEKFISITAKSSEKFLSYSADTIYTMQGIDLKVVDLRNLRIGIKFNSEQYDENSLRMVESSLRALQDWFGFSFQIEYLLSQVEDESDFDFLIWLDSRSSIPSSVGKVVIFQPRALRDETEILVAQDNLLFVLPLNLVKDPESISGLGLSERLFDILLYPIKHPMVDERVFDKEEDLTAAAVSSEAGLKSTEISRFNKPMVIPLLVLLVLLIITERIMSQKLKVSGEGSNGSK